jgi:hypothetical protein
MDEHYHGFTFDVLISDRPAILLSKFRLQHLEWSLKKEEEKEKGKSVFSYTFHESDVAGRVLHEQCFDPKPALDTPVLHRSLKRSPL